MKLDKFIRDSCCNYVRNECIGVWNRSLFNDTYICHPINKEEPLLCNFFEKIVLPSAIKLGYHDEMVDQYSKVDYGVVIRTMKIRKKEKIKANEKARKIRNSKKKAKKSSQATQD